MKGKWGRRRRYVYAYDVQDWRYTARPVKVGYVGKTSSNPRYRDTQHRNGKDWAKAIVGEMRIVWAGDCGRIALWFREVHLIHKLAPMFNVDHNGWNPDRIEPWRARRLYGGRPMSYPRR